MAARRVLSALVVGAALLALPAWAAELPLQPGDLVGALTPYEVKRHDSISAIALRYTVNPVRVTKPSAPSLRDGLQVGEVITVDARRIKPRFPNWMSGIVLNVPEAQVYLVEGGSLVKDYPVAVSAPETPVQIGRTRVVSMQENPTWYVPKSIQEENARLGREVKTEVPPGPRNPLGPRWIGFWDGSFGFHGTNVPTSIKKYASHGCVRFLAHDIKDLYRRVSVGTPVHVLYQPVQLAVSASGVWVSCFPDIYEKRFDYAGAVRTLAGQAGVLDQIDWTVVTKAAKDQDGIVRNVSRYRLEGVPLAAPATPAPQLYRKVKGPAAKPTPGVLATEGEILAPEPVGSAAPKKRPAARPQPRPSGLILWGEEAPETLEQSEPWYQPSAQP